MHARPPLRPAGARSRPHARTSLAAVFGVLALTAGCDGRDAPADPRPAPTASSAEDGPLALYRLATLRAPDGESATIEALAPCRVLLEVVQGARHDGGHWRDLDPGDALRIVFGLVPDEDAATGSTGAAAPTGQGRRVGYRLHYGFAEGDLRNSLVRVQAHGPSPWVRTATATPPVSAKPVPEGGVALATLAVADVSSAAGLALVSGPVPAITGAPPGTPAEHLQLVSLWLRVSPR